jgi:hypothetical protein
VRASFQFLVKRAVSFCMRDDFRSKIKIKSFRFVGQLTHHSRNRRKLQISSVDSLTQVQNILDSTAHIENIFDVKYFALTAYRSQYFLVWFTYYSLVFIGSQFSVGASFQ